MVLPAAAPGIITGVVLALARIAGETAPLLFTAFNNRFFSTELDQPISSLTVQVFTYAISPYEDWHRQAWAGALVLVALVLFCSLLARCRDAPPRAAADRTVIRCAVHGQLHAPTPAAQSWPRRPTPRRSPPSCRRRETRRSRRRRWPSTSTRLSFFYGSKQALFDITAQLPAKQVTAFIGPSGCGKSTFLRTLNRMNDVIPGARVDRQGR